MPHVDEVCNEKKTQTDISIEAKAEAVAAAVVAAAAGAAAAAAAETTFSTAARTGGGRLKAVSKQVTAATVITLSTNVSVVSRALFNGCSDGGGGGGWKRHSLF